MYNNIIKLDDVQKICIDNNYQYIPSIKLHEKCVELLNSSIEFSLYLSGKDFDYYELPNILFWEIINFIFHIIWND